MGFARQQEAVPGRHHPVEARLNRQRDVIGRPCRTRTRETRGLGTNPSVGVEPPKGRVE
jgi:hypothetical protein